MSILAIIPAKASSSRIPGKNLRPLGGVPLFLWTVRAAREVQPRMTVVVSTDAGPAGDEIAGLAIREGAAVVRRPKELCEDPAQAPDVAIHALNYIEQHGRQTFDTVVMLLPTSPFRTARHIEEALQAHRSDAFGPVNVVSVNDASDLNHKWCPEYAGRIVAGPPIRDRQWAAMTNHHTSRLLNGAIWVATPSRLRTEGYFNAIAGWPYLMDRTSGLDIDTELDWLVAEAIIAQRKAAA
jgi:CMP-N,N'-diacetyllegionaminic acid synthase